MARVVSEAGWDGAQALLDEDWRCWEAEFLAAAVPLAITAWRDADRLDDRRFLARLLGGRR